MPLGSARPSALSENPTPPSLSRAFQTHAALVFVGGGAAAAALAADAVAAYSISTITCLASCWESIELLGGTSQCAWEICCCYLYWYRSMSGPLIRGWEFINVLDGATHGA